MKIYIRGFAEAQKEVERKLSAHTDEIIEHIIKLIVMPDNSARNHWEGEIAGQINRIERLRNSKKFPKAKQIYDWTYGKKQDLVTDRGWMSVAMRDLADQYGDLEEIAVDDLCDVADYVCRQYFSWLADELSTVGRVATRDIYDKLDSLV
ncbi:MAG: hypothetical protein NC489_18140 [Ruminococcus flavefaciens]|nr:hypothetical protein [Ruminococcus flavefaciens]